MTEKILDYRTVSSPEQAIETIKHFENKYHRDYNWNVSLGEIEEAVAVCLLETDSGNRYVTTTKRMDYIERRKVVNTIDLGEL